MTTLSTIDLNLIHLFSVLYKTQSVRETADTLNLSQSACSHALQRLRERLNDDLFVRVGNTMQPTEYAKAIADKLILGMNLIEEGITSYSAFNPNDDHTFKIAVTDYTSWCMRAFVSTLSQDYPNIKIEFLNLEERLPEITLREGKFDLVCGFAHDIESFESISNQVWFEDHYICLHHREHPFQHELSLEKYLNYRHVVVTPWNEAKGILDITLSKMRKKRKVAIKTPNVLSAPVFIIDSQYLLAIPKRYADHVAQQLPVTISPLPFEVPTYKVKLYWHKTRNNDPKIQWLSNRIIKS
ncbi:LysR family transcriptional regulator [Vibrio zhanjiangensis]|uniref:LysR family transcriptional regulator n=1 Tax=Vibrio zhanjiangensis TaxID=1046128 RepID=A0ABQ6EWR6_9VIBR|nr:LysR family transcriptional regulator [Vibrio zhanjiangensis]GLT16955.1 LysR family transcriptional regulator [Vibrio zhanjiangensis]